MSPGKILKVLWRSRSLSFAAHYRSSTTNRDGGRGVYAWRTGDGADVHFRRGTSDVGIIYDVLLKPGRKAEYWLPEELEPRTILDIGGNIGITSRYLAHFFPGAQVHAFEPVPANLELLRSNTAGNVRIHVHPYALGPADGEITLGSPDPSGYNQGGYSAFTTTADGETICAPVRSVESALGEAGMGVADVIKIDTEGAEYSILSAIPEPVLGGARWIYGELHTEAIAQRSDLRVLDFLSRWFDIDVYKPVRKKNYF
ncbi:MAG TPA: FkbM family methyltransferase, partial [Burkholderiales bacterium]|nr:FkbM family methyltransferase [Burkholderiales bacterium]